MIDLEVLQLLVEGMAILVIILIMVYMLYSGEEE